MTIADLIEELRRIERYLLGCRGCIDDYDVKFVPASADDKLALADFGIDHKRERIELFVMVEK